MRTDSYTKEALELLEESAGPFDRACSLLREAVRENEGAGNFVVNDSPEGPPFKPILLVDFDGVIHSYDSGWAGIDVIPDPPVPGAIPWLKEALNHFRVCIYSSRSKEPSGVSAMIEAICRWAREEYGMIPSWVEMLEFPTQKPAAFLTIDDRAIRFRGNFGEIEPVNLLNFRPWNK